MTGTTIVDSALVAGRYNPRAVLDVPIEHLWDFVETGGRTVVDAALADETDPYGYFYSTATSADGVWLVSHDAVDAATQLPTAQTGAGGDGGVIKFTTDATSGERISMQHVGSSFIMATGRPMLFRCRCKFTNTTQDAFIGLAVTGATDPHASRPAGFIAFTLTGDAVLQKASGDAGTATASAALDTTTSIVADTWVELAIYWDGVDTCTFFVNGTSKGTTALTLPTTLVLSPVVTVESNGAAEAMFVDYIQVAVRRS